MSTPQPVAAATMRHINANLRFLIFLASARTSASAPSSLGDLLLLMPWEFLAPFDENRFKNEKSLPRDLAATLKRPTSSSTSSGVMSRTSPVADAVIVNGVVVPKWMRSRAK